MLRLSLHVCLIKLDSSMFLCTKDLLVIAFLQFSQSMQWLLSLCFKNNRTVKNNLIKNSPQCHEGCIYTVPCKDCNRFYIGQTGKTLEQRKKKHKYSVRAGQESNALFVHVRDSSHCIDWENCKKVITSKSFVERNILESSLIKHTILTLVKDFLN